MTTFSQSPKIQKGAIMVIDPQNPQSSSIVFQYNPDTMTRSLKAQTAGTESANRTEPMRLKGAPIETISLSVEIDASDQLEGGMGIASEMGIYPQLSALEMLIYPPSSVVIANADLIAAGTIELVPPEAPMTLFMWGANRILPVRLTDFSITEEAYDVNLNPLRAKVSLNLRVLSYNDLPRDNPGYNFFMAHQVAKEAMARIGMIGSTSVAASAASAPAPNTSGSISFSVSGSFKVG